MRCQSALRGTGRGRSACSRFVGRARRWCRHGVRGRRWGLQVRARFGTRRLDRSLTARTRGKEGLPGGGASWSLQFLGLQSAFGAAGWDRDGSRSPWTLRAPPWFLQNKSTLQDLFLRVHWVFEEFVSLIKEGENVPASCCLRRPGGWRFCRTFEMEIGLERRADNVTAFRRSWPPPSQKLPSIWMMVCAMLEAIANNSVCWDSGSRTTGRGSSTSQ